MYTLPETLDINMLDTPAFNRRAIKQSNKRKQVWATVFKQSTDIKYNKALNVYLDFMQELKERSTFDSDIRK